MSELTDPGLRSLHDALEIGLVLWSADEELRYANQASLALLGLSVAELKQRGPGAALTDLIDIDGTPVQRDALPLRRALATGAPVRNMPVGFLRGEERAWLLLSATPRVEDGVVIDVLCTVTDFSGERDRLEGLRATLEERNSAFYALEAQRQVVAEHTQARIGEPFFTTKPPGHGTGLGLATVYATLRGLGGEVSWQSRVGVGTTVELQLPLAPAPQPEGDTAARAAAPGQKRVLIIDDEAMVRSTLRRLLVAEGLTVNEAIDGEDGLAQVARASQPFDVVFLDLSMPGLPPADVIEALATAAPAVPVIVLSGYVRPEIDLSHARLVLEKPLSVREFLDALRSVVGGDG